MTLARAFRGEKVEGHPFFIQLIFIRRLLRPRSGHTKITYSLNSRSSYQNIVWNSKNSSDLG